MQVISVVNMKGGVGKTTLVVNIAYGLAYFHGKKVLVVDVDPQFNATQCLLGDTAYLKYLQDPKKGTVHDIFVPRKAGSISTLTGTVEDRGKGESKTCICPVFGPRGSSGRLDLIPSTLALIELEYSPRQTERRLRTYIKQKANGYDFVLVDCPPTISIFTQAAILASSKYLVPIKPDPLSVIGLSLLERWLEEFTEDSGMTLSRIGIVFTMVRGPAPAKMKEVMSELRKRRAGEVFASEMTQATAVASSVEHHQPVFLFSNNSKSAAQIKRITAEFLKRVEA